MNGGPDEKAELAAHIRQLFLHHIDSNSQVEDLKDLGDALPSDPADLQALHGLCWSESRKALRNGQHLRMRRLEGFAHQLQEHLQKLGRNA